MRHTCVFAAIALLVAGSVAWGQEKTVAGRVVDADGKAVANATLGSFWMFAEGEWVTHNGFTSDADGAFSGAIRYWNRPTALIAMDDARRRGGLVILDETSIDEPATITLVPLVDVRGTIVSPELGRAPEWTNVYAELNGGQVQVASFSSQAAEFAFRLPPGDYRLQMYGTDLDFHNKNVTVAADSDPIDLGAVEVPPTVIAKHYGKAPPKWTLVDARGAEKTVTITDYKGKWVLLEFWGFW